MKLTIVSQIAAVWPYELPNAPEELVKIVTDAMVDYADVDDNHCRGGAEIAAIVWWWIQKKAKETQP